MIATKLTRPVLPCIAVLAAGFSRRLGRSKALLPIHGRPLLRRTLQIAASLHPRTLIAVVPPRHAPHRRLAQGMAVTFKANPARAAGLATSVQCALHAARFAPALLLLPVDLYALSPCDLRRLVRRWRARPRQVVARRMGEQGGTPAIVPKHLFARCKQVRGDVGLRELLNTFGAALTLVDLPSASRDLDTPADWADARRRFPRN